MVHADRGESRVSDTWLGPALAPPGRLGVLDELRVQMRTASLSVIVLTAQHGESEEKALDLGAQDYLTQPVQTRSLVARIRAVLKRVNS
jgi:DNA-binding response OmpR family regulator